MTVKAFRSGETSPYWSKDPYKEAMSVHDDELRMSFSMPSKGGGVTEVALQIADDSFEELAALMLKASPHAAIRAFGAALAAWQPEPSS
ncbi:MAG: hypothetical protein KGQ37_13165 [Hyphomicrobiales bacterium]|nr:hypothetical protein [Hyphomicrobiales bacterium]